ncbi:HAD family hydrolase [Arthrobacter psychrolactophilus]|nr:HAD family phosphatase [Arthrobacter psychrolactophilus]
MLQAVFWDMDGTIVDTEPFWFIAQHKLAAEFGVSWTEEQAKLLIGSALSNSAKVMQDAGIDMGIDDIISTLTASVQNQVTADVIWRPGAKELLAELREQCIPCVLVTMSHHPLAAEVLSHLPEGTFEFMITGDMVTQGKPHPEPYLMAAELLGKTVENLSINRCVAIEDSRPGLASAHASGAVALGVPNLVTLMESPGLTLWPTLGGMTVADLQGLVEERALVSGRN